MKAVFAGVLILFAILFIVARGSLESTETPGVTRLRWATDINPARELQTSRFAELYPGLEAVVDPGLGGDQTKLIVQCATGTGPDIIDVYSKEQMMSLVQSGILVDLTPYAEEMGFSVDKTYPALKDGLMVDGRQYRFPCNVWANCIVYNKQVFERLGVPVPEDDWTWMDFIDTCREIEQAAEAGGDDTLAFCNWHTQWAFGELHWGRGGRMFTEDGLTSLLDSEEAVFAMQFYYDLMHRYDVIPTTNELSTLSSQGGWGSGGLTLFSVGRAAMMIIGRWYLCQVPDYPDLVGNLGAVRLPHFEGHPQTGLCDARAAGININSPHWKDRDEEYRRKLLSFPQYLAGEDYGRIIVNDGDAMPPNPNLALNGEMLVNKPAPDPAFHQPFVDALEDARPLDTSPFIDALVVQRWLQERIDQVENQITPPDEAMEELAREINSQIRVNLERQPHLQRKYKEVTGRPYTDDWWKEHQGHSQ